MTYTTRAGDMWDFIAFKTLGSELFTNLLINANRQHIHTFIFPGGVELIIPTINQAEQIELPPWYK